MNILDEIIENKRSEVRRLETEVPLQELENREFFSREILSLKKSLLNKSGTGLIPEFKRKSPSKGIINAQADVAEVTQAYARGGAAGLSVLTDEKFFGGQGADLVKARINEIPILRKDFIIEVYQITESRAMGADVILLIAACLDPGQIRQLASFAKKIEMEVLLELHEESELDHLCDEVDFVGINNRNLKTFKVDIERSLRMAEKIPADKLKIAESGISSPETIKLFKENGYNGFLMGEHFMREPDPGLAFEKFVEQLKSQKVL